MFGVGWVRNNKGQGLICSRRNVLLHFSLGEKLLVVEFEGPSREGLEFKGLSHLQTQVDDSGHLYECPFPPLQTRGSHTRNRLLRWNRLQPLAGTQHAWLAKEDLFSLPTASASNWHPLSFLLLSFLWNIPRKVKYKITFLNFHYFITHSFVSFQWFLDVLVVQQD